MTLSSLTRLSDTALTIALESSVRDERRSTAIVVAHIAEFDARKLFAPAGYSSMHAYCMGRLHLSRDAAFRRIRAARKARRYASILPMLADGRLHLTAILVLSDYLTSSNAEELLAAAVHKSREEIELMLAHRFPKADVPTRLRPITGTHANESQQQVALAPGDSSPDGSGKAVSGEEANQSLLAPAPVEPGTGANNSPLAPAPVASAGGDGSSSHSGTSMPTTVSPAGGADAPAQLAPMPVGASGGEVIHESRPADDGYARVKPLAPERFALQVTIDQATHDKLRRAQALLGHQVASRDIAGVLERALDALIEKLEKRKLAATAKPRAARALRSNNPRYVPAHVKRAVAERDGGRCTFTSEDGHRCEARTDLEWDHIRPVARGGRPTVENIRQRCRVHNQHAAECVYGAEFMEAKRGPSRAMRIARSDGALH
jgi:hypothetical protein